MKKIVLLSDGTGNGAAKRNKTNVWRLYSALDLQRKDQIAMYDDGVGSKEFLLFKILGGAFGWGLKRNVIELYKFLCRNYKTYGDEAENDKIYLFGFSRGAFTVRIVAGLIAECGLYTKGETERDLHKIALHNYGVYRNRFRRWQLFSFIIPKRAKQDAWTTVWPDIEFIGVWDTVDAYGLPVREWSFLWDTFIFPIRFPDRQLSKKILKACHAISIDDERLTFEPVLWDECRESDPGRIEQVWFSGVHSDVGGGYPREQLTLVSLDWMISRVNAQIGRSSGLHFIPDLRKEYRRRSDWHGIQHDSRAGLAAYYRYEPRNIEELCNQPKCRCRGEGVKVTVPKIHRSVFERIQGQVVPYAPTGLPAKYDIVSTRGRSVNLQFENQNDITDRIDAMSGALDIIWWRRWIYWAFLATTLMLVFSGQWLDWAPHAPCTALACVSDPMFEFFMNIFPSFFASWIEPWRQNQLFVLLFIALYFLLSRLKSYASSETLSRATTAWSALKKSPRPPTRSPTTTAKLRNILGSQGRRTLRRIFWTTVFVLILIGIFVASGRILLHIRDSMG